MRPKSRAIWQGPRGVDGECLELFFAGGVAFQSSVIVNHEWSLHMDRTSHCSMEDREVAFLLSAVDPTLCAAIGFRPHKDRVNGTRPRPRPGPPVASEIDRYRAISNISRKRNVQRGHSAMTTLQVELPIEIMPGKPGSTMCSSTNERDPLRARRRAKSRASSSDANCATTRRLCFMGVM